MSKIGRGALVAAAFLVLWALGCQKSVPAAPDWGTGYKVLFLGDTDFGESYRKLDPRILVGEYDRSFELVRPLLTSADWVIANLETPIVDPKAVTSPHEGKKEYIHWADPLKAPEYLKKNNIHTLCLANNHILDYGVPGLASTLDVMSKTGMTGFGAGMTQADAEKPFEKEIPLGARTVKLAVFGAFEHSASYEKEYAFYANGDTPGAALLSAERTSQLVREYKTANPGSIVVVYPHWGGNYQWRSKSQRRIAQAVLSAGADIVIGHGAHCVQQIEMTEGRLAVYNIGNFIFSSPGRYRKYIKTKKIMPYGFAALARFAEDGGATRVDLRLYPIYTDNRKTGYQPHALTDEDFAKLDERMRKKTASPTRFDNHARTGRDGFGPYYEFKAL